jgi:NAD(P)-dependent dehydrogenase (short-subunit alcohol dehydrogenase family)
MDLKLRGKAIIVTGASKGIGAATTRLLSAEGAGVVLVARGAEELQRNAEACDGETVAVALDVTDPGAAERIIAACVERFGRVDGLVNNAGIIKVTRPEDLTDEYWLMQLQLSVMAPMRLMRAAAPKMVEGGGGRIVNVCSMGSKQPSLLDMAYCVAKAGQLSLSRLFANQWAPRGVLVNAVLPGVIDSPMWTGEGGIADQVAALEGSDRGTVISDAERAAPIGRLGSSEEVAAAIAFLCSDQSSFVTGAAWQVDGGIVPTML